MSLNVQTLGSSPLALRTLRALRRVAKEHDVVVAYGSRTLPACALALAGGRVPWVYRSIGDPAAWARGKFQCLRTKLLLRSASRVVALWDEAGEWFVDAYGVRSEDVVVIPNARCTDTYRPPTAGERRAAREQFGIASDQQVVAVVGSLTSEKRVGLALAAIAKIDGAVALIAGDGAGRSDLEALAGQLLPGRVVFAGVLDDVRPAYWAADCLLLASRTEGMPGVLIEAAMSGLPVVATAVGAIPTMFQKGIFGQLAALDTSATSFANALEEAMAVRPSEPVSLGWDEVSTLWGQLVSSVAATTSEVAQ